jgi:hypothetical protein
MAFREVEVYHLMEQIICHFLVFLGLFGSNIFFEIHLKNHCCLFFLLYFSDLFNLINNSVFEIIDMESLRLFAIVAVFILEAFN